MCEGGKQRLPEYCLNPEKTFEPMGGKCYGKEFINYYQNLNFSVP